MFNYLFDWDKEFFRFNCLTGSGTPYKVIRAEDGSKATIVYNAVGVNKDDIKIEINKENGISYLELSGETKNEIVDSVYSFKSRFKVNADAIKNIEYSIDNGLLYVEIFWKEPEKLKIDIKEKK